MKKLTAFILTASLLSGLSSGAFAQALPRAADMNQVLAGAAETEPSLSGAAETEQAQPEEIIETEEPVSAFLTDDAYSDITVRSMEEAAAVVADRIGEIGGDDQTQFEPWRTIEDSKGNRYYVFRQMYGDVTVSGGAVKVVTDQSGKMLGLVSSVEKELPDTKTGEGISAEEADEVVTYHMKKSGHSRPEILDGYTKKIILPVNLELDPESEEEKEEVRFVWAVYTENDESSKEKHELPYLAHYVTMDGEYLYSLPTIIPSDEAGNSGFQASYLFEFMEPAPYTGTVTLSDGTQQEISVTLMRDSRTGMYYLGNLERRIVVADCYEFLYNKGNVVLEASPDNTGWDDTCLLSLWNYCRAWDYYKEIGWNGGDGLGTPMMILKDFCDRNHEPVNNAAYAGAYYGWQLFLSSSANDFSQCLDVLAHEFTHCVTGSVMTYNAYMNDYGAINEAVSDIQGNLCEMMAGATEDTTWELGENSSIPIRNMCSPHKHHQPEFTWDIYYVPNVKIPTATNDRGGVHANSSLLNRIAYLLCTEGGMTYEEARDFWFAADCSMVPGTDYAQLSRLMPWVLANIGLDRYLPSLEKAIEETGIGSNEVPSTFGEDRALVKLEFPDTESFADGNWLLSIVSVDAERIGQRVHDIIYKEGECAEALDELGEAMLDAAGAYIFDGEGETIFEEVLTAWYQKYFEGMINQGTGAAGADGKTVQLVSAPGYTIPILLYMKIEPSKSRPSGFGLALFLNGRWTDLMELSQEMTAASEKGLDPEAFSWLFESADTDFFYKIRSGEECVIPADGLEEVKPFDIAVLDEMFPAEEKG